MFSYDFVILVAFAACCYCANENCITEKRTRRHNMHPIISFFKFLSDRQAKKIFFYFAILATRERNLIRNPEIRDSVLMFDVIQHLSCNVTQTRYELEFFVFRCVVWLCGGPFVVLLGLLFI